MTVPDTLRATVHISALVAIGSARHCSIGGALTREVTCIDRIWKTQLGKLELSSALSADHLRSLPSQNSSRCYFVAVPNKIGRDRVHVGVHWHQQGFDVKSTDFNTVAAAASEMLTNRSLYHLHRSIENVQNI